ncbi:very short patch repair endonuclease [Myxococcus hansupus]|uniref:very short patch repair endonuclease n=1 Tax=Pseudomyxococcus hansupus TaxID=1297742 RepID=UPI0005D131CE|nr:very short patch repair endonuclease [Myxococcus hansupus]
MDSLTPAQRSERMRRVRSKHSRPEIAVRRMAYALGHRFRLHVSGVFGHPDLVFSGKRKVVFVHGCFWHRHRGCSRTRTPKSRVAFWEAKFEANVARDRDVRRRLRREGWDVLVVWECETEKPERLRRTLGAFLGEKR